MDLKIYLKNGFHVNNLALYLKCSEDSCKHVRFTIFENVGFRIFLADSICRP